MGNALAAWRLPSPESICVPSRNLTVRARVRVSVKVGFRLRAEAPDVVERLWTWVHRFHHPLLLFPRVDDPVPLCEHLRITSVKSRLGARFRTLANPNPRISVR